jgi:ferrochelatase
MEKKIAVILLNLGGPDKLSSVKDFLFNLFYDSAIISLINPFRWLLAKLISSKREGKAKAIYSKIGGRSPILPLTDTRIIISLKLRLI